MTPEKAAHITATIKCWTVQKELYPYKSGHNGIVMEPLDVDVDILWLWRLGTPNEDKQEAK
jgi:hypothetical protein